MLFFRLGFTLIPLFAFAVTGETQPSIQRGNDTIFNKNEIIVRRLGKDTIEISGWKNGKLNGEQKLFYGNNRLSSITQFKDGQQNGIQKTFHSANGILISEGTYKYFPKLKKSLLNGKFTRYYYSDGKVSEEYNYVQGKRNGKYKRIHPNGNLQEEGIFEDDLVKGIKKTYQLNGILRSEEQYIIIDNPDYVVKRVLKDTSQIKVWLDVTNDTEIKPKKKPSEEDKYIEIAPHNIPQKISILNGKSTYYTMTGEIQSALNFKNGKKDGLCIEYYPNSHQIRSKVVFQAGEEHGDFIYYRQDGKKEREGRYFKTIDINGTTYKNVYDGINIFYQDNGEKQRLETWSNFQKNGLQETYHYRTGTLSSRFYMENGLKKGEEIYFDTDGNKTAETTYEIVELDSVNVSQITGIKKSWKNKQLTSETTYKNGVIDGTYTEYYENKFPLVPKEIKTFIDGNLNGSYKTYYPSGKIKSDKNYRYDSKSKQNNLLGWCSEYDEDGNLISRFFAHPTTSYLLQQTFENQKQVELDIPRRLNIRWNHQKISSLRISDIHNLLGFETFSNGQLRRIYFLSPKFGEYLIANFLSDGSVNQVTNNGTVIQMTAELKKLVQQIARQFNPQWLDEKVDFLVKNGNEYYTWKYKDGSPFLNFQFRDSLLSGKFTVFNPIISGDTLLHSEFEKGEAVGSWVRKNMEGTVLYRKLFYSNHIEKEVHLFWNSGKPMEVIKQDSSKNVTFNLRYYENGQLKEHREPLISSYVSFNENGDTASFRWLYPIPDSIFIERDFYKENKLRYQQVTNNKTGGAYRVGYFENGQKQYYQTYKSRKKEGRYEQFNENGQLLRTGNFLDDKREGKWIVYEHRLINKDSIWVADTLLYQKGELIVSEEKNIASCRCQDKSLPAASVGFANSLAYLVDYKKIAPAIPKNIIPIDNFNYDKIYYLNLQYAEGFADMKLLPYKEFSFYFPSEEFMKFTLNPCSADGYIPNFRANIHYNSNEKSISYASLYPNKITVSLVNNPLKIAENKSDYKALFDVKSMEINSNGIQSILSKPYPIHCFPDGIIKETLELQISKANIVLRPSSTLSPIRAPLLKNEMEKMYGLAIHEASVSFAYPIEKGDTVKIKGISKEIYAGYHFVAGSIQLEGKIRESGGFQLLLKEGRKIVFEKDIQRFFEERGFFRVKVELKDNRTLEIQFYTEN